MLTNFSLQRQWGRGGVCQHQTRQRARGGVAWAPFVNAADRASPSGNFGDDRLTFDNNRWRFLRDGARRDHPGTDIWHGKCKLTLV